ncbi:MAG: deoxyribonuclease IV [bacterium]
MMKEPLLGVHLSIAGGVEKIFEEAERLKINCFQIFLGSPRIWHVKEPSPEQIAFFRENLKKYKFCNVHAPYLLNFATENDKLFKSSVNRAVRDMQIMKALGIKYYVIHPGSSPIAGGLVRVKRAIDEVLKRVSDGIILVENLSGEKNDVGKNIEEITEIIDGFGERTGICIDTCHLFSSGVDIRSEVELSRFYDALVKNNLEKRVKMIHANDSKKALGSKIDRHEHIGKGEIGKKGFFNLLHHPFFKTLPFILETPKEDNADEKNLASLKTLFKLEKV